MSKSKWVSVLDVPEELELRIEGLSEKIGRVEICENCRFWKPIVLEIGYKPANGYCRRNPPQVVAEYTSRVWPETAEGDWCGEFQNKNNPTFGLPSDWDPTES